MRLQIFSAFIWTVISLALQGSGTTPPQNGGTVSGTVLYGDTGKPASGIRLWLTPEKQPGTQPDGKTGDYVVRDSGGERRIFTQVAPDGTFTLKDVPPGLYLVHTFSPSYISPDDTVYPTSNATHVAVGPSASSNALRVEVISNVASHRVDVLLQRGGTIEGSVMLPASSADASGSSRAGLAINAERKLGDNAYARVGGAAHTDSKGHYQLDGLAPGDYILFVGMGRELPIYSPGTVRPSRADVVHLHSSETQHLDFALPSSLGLHRIEGRVQMDDAEPVQNPLVRLYPNGEGGLTAAKPLTAAHSFAFENLPDGDYTIELEFSPSSRVLSVDAAEGVIHMRMTPSPYVNSTRNVHVEGNDVTAILLTATRR